MKHVIHIFGGSGSGTTTLGSRIGQQPGWTHLDCDDYFWLPTDPPYTTKRPVEDRVRMIQQDIDKAQNVVISGSMVKWGAPLIPCLTLCIRTVLEPSVRLERLQRREKEKFGDRIEPGGDMYEQHQEFLNWAAQYDDGPATMRSRAMHDQWQEQLMCPVLTVDTAEDAKTIFLRLKNEGYFDGKA